MDIAYISHDVNLMSDKRIKKNALNEKPLFFASDL